MNDQRSALGRAQRAEHDARMKRRADIRSIVGEDLDAMVREQVAEQVQRALSERDAAGQAREAAARAARIQPEMRPQRTLWTSRRFPAPSGPTPQWQELRDEGHAATAVSLARYRYPGVGPGDMWPWAGGMYRSGVTAEQATTNLMRS